MFLGMWLGAAVLVDVLAARNFATIDSFIPAPGSSAVTARIAKAGRDSIRVILRRNAAEENAAIFEVWEWSQIGIATVFFFLILCGDRPPASALVLVPVMIVILLLQRFVLTPHVVSLGREVDEIPARELTGNPTVAHFWAFHGVYSGCEILKLLLGLAVGARLMIRRTHDRPQREYDREAIGAGESASRLQAAHSQSERRTRKRRKTDQDG